MGCKNCRRPWCRGIHHCRGATGPTGFGVTGPTGFGATGPTGPTGFGVTGPTGSSAGFMLKFSGLLGANSLNAMADSGRAVVTIDSVDYAVPKTGLSLDSFRIVACDAIPAGNTVTLTLRVGVTVISTAQLVGPQPAFTQLQGSPGTFNVAINPGDVVNILAQNSGAGDNILMTASVGVSG